jgi:two-component system, OmpR family, heavy metal sensor histidine kinase CusS
VRSLSIRWRLTLWYGAVLSVILLGFCAAVYLLMERHLLSLTDATLREELDELGAEVTRARSLAELPAGLELRFPGQEGYELQVGTLTGELLFRSVGIGSKGLPRPVDLPLDLGAPAYESVNLNGYGPVRLSSRVLPAATGSVLIQAAVTLAPNIHAMRELVAVFLTIGPVALVSTLAGGFWLARKALSPVDRMAATAAEITATQLDRRLAEPEAKDELGYLAQTFNAMIARLQRSFDEVHRFTADAAHELRTPLAAMRTEAEVALRSPRSPERDARVLENLLEEIERLTRLVSHLLFLCREETGVGVGDLRPVRLDEIVIDVCEHMKVVAREKRLELLVEHADTCVVNGEADRLRQLFFNLLDNAIKYTQSGGKVTVETQASSGQALVTVTDTGIGIASEHLPHVFDRFYRVDSSRSSETEGTGLGLAICRSIAESHAGRIEIASTPATGTRVTLMLPMRRDDVITARTKDRTAPLGSELFKQRSESTSPNLRLATERSAMHTGFHHSV